MLSIIKHLHEPNTYRKKTNTNTRYIYTVYKSMDYFNFETIKVKNLEIKTTHIVLAFFSITNIININKY